MRGEKRGSEDEGVAEAASGLDGVGGVFGVASDLGAEGFDMGVDGAVHGGAGVIPSLLEELFAGEDAAGLPEEDREEVLFVGGEFERMAATGHGHGVGLVAQE